MSDTLPLITVVAPVFNEQDVLPLFHTELTRVLNTLTGQFDYEIIYVDDGSRDATPDLLHLFAEKDSRVRFIRFSRNFGQQAAMTAGFENGRGDAIITMDSDLQHPPIMIPQMSRNGKRRGCRSGDSAGKSVPGFLQTLFFLPVP